MHLCGQSLLQTMMNEKFSWLYSAGLFNICNRDVCYRVAWRVRIIGSRLGLQPSPLTLSSVWERVSRCFESMHVFGAWTDPRKVGLPYS